MSFPQKILAVVGTRPEAIKMAPVISCLARDPQSFTVVVCATAQHREMLDSVLEIFGIRPDVDLDLMRPDQTLNEISSAVFAAFDGVLTRTAPDWVLIQGDTTTAMAVSLSSFHRKVRVGHIEAGLRTGDFADPFPEEMNRRVVDLAASLHFAPTSRAAAALQREGVAENQIHVTGNTVVDAVRYIAAQACRRPSTGQMVLITSHRRESFGEPMRRSFRAIARLARRFPSTRFLFPVHPNPGVRAAAKILEGIPNVDLVPPADYRQLIAWIQGARLILTDSGGIQEEAPAFGKPVLVLRDTTERPEAIEAGVAKLVGTDEEKIFSEAEKLLTDEAAYAAMARVVNPFGDGGAAERIVAVLAGRPMTPFTTRSAP